MRRLGLLTLVLLGCLGGGIAQADDPSLQLRWHMDTVTGGTSTPDSSGKNHPGTGTATAITGKFSNGISGRMAATAAGFPQPAQLTVMAWVRSVGDPVASGEHGWIVSYGGVDSPCPFTTSDYGFEIYPDGSMNFETEGAGGTIQAVGGATSMQLWDGSWHAIAGTYDGTKLHFYLDGVEKGTGTAAGPINYTGTPNAFTVGKFSGNCRQEVYTGQTDEVRLYNRALSSAEIAYLHGSLGGQMPRVLPIPPAAQSVSLQHHLDTVASGTTPDSSGNGLDGVEAGNGTIVPGRFGSAFSTATGGYRIADNPLLNPQAFTAAAWVKYSGAAPSFKTIFGKSASSCSTTAWQLRTIGNGDVGFYVSLYTPTGGQSYLLTNLIPAAQVFDGQWHALAGTYANGVASLWMDGTKRFTATASGPDVGPGGVEEIDYPRYAESHAAVGRYPANACALGEFPGAIDEVRLYDRVLTDGQIATLQAPAASTPPVITPEPTATPIPTVTATPVTPTPTTTPTPNPTGDLRVQWHLDANGAAQPDTSGNGFAGTATGTTLISGGRFAGAQRNGTISRPGAVALEPSQLTATVWVRSATPVKNAILARYGAADCTEDASWAFQTDSSGGITVPGMNVYIDPGDVWDGRWHMLALTRSADQYADLYLDGATQVLTGPQFVGTTQYPDGAKALSVGGCSASAGADVDEFRLYGAALTADQIAYLWRPSHVEPASLPIPAGDTSALGLLAQYHMDKIVPIVESDPVTPDSSGNGHPGSHVTSALVNGRFGNAFSDGGFVADSLHPAHVSLLAWVRGTGTPGSQSIVSLGGGSECDPGAAALITDGTGDIRLRVDVANLPRGTGPIAAADVYDGKWHAVAGTYDGTTMTLWLDGAEVSEIPVPDGGGPVDYNFDSNPGLAVGRHSVAGCGATFTGDLDEVSVYDRAVTPTEIRYLQNADATFPPDLPATDQNVVTPEPEPDLALKWHFDISERAHDDDPFTVARDFSGNGLDGKVDTAKEFVPGRFASGVRFDEPAAGQEQGIVSRPDARLEPTKITLLAWLRASPQQVNTPNPVISTIATYGGIASSCKIGTYGFQTEGTSVRFSAFTSDIPLANTVQADVFDGQWHAVAGTFDGQRLQLYVDGVKVPQGVLDGLAGSALNYSKLTTRGLRVGGQSNAGCVPGQTQRFPGDVDEVRVYKRALSADELAYLSAGNHRKPPTLPAPSEPRNTTRPLIAGAPKTGNTLTCQPGAWTGQPTQFTYLWERAPRSTHVDGDGAWAAIEGATGTTYQLQKEDTSSRVRCREIVTNAALMTEEAVSKSLRVDADVPGAVAGAAPQVTGGLVIGSKLTCLPGSWTNGPEDGDFSYRWLKDGKFTGVTTQTFLPKKTYTFSDATFAFSKDDSGDGDHQISCEVTARNDVGASAPVVSGEIHLVDTAPIPWEDSDGEETYGRVDVALSSETNPLQQTATCVPPRFHEYYGAANGFPDTFQWTRFKGGGGQGEPIAGATAKTYHLTADDLGRSILCTMTASNPAGTRAVEGRPKFIPLPIAALPAKIDTVYRNNRYDPINLLATSDAYQIKAHNLFAQMQTQQLDAISTACATAQGRARETAPPPTEIIPTNTIFGQAEIVKNPALSPPQQCWVLNHVKITVSLTPVGWVWNGFDGRCDPGAADPSFIVRYCRSFGISVQPVDPSTAAALPLDVQNDLAPVTPVRVLWDVDNDGDVDLSCPGSSPVIRGNYDPGQYSPRAVIVNPDSAATGMYASATTTFDFPNASADRDNQGNVIKGAPRYHDQPLWCRNTIAAPPDPATAPCVSTGSVGRVMLTGNLCPMNVRSISDDALADLPAEEAAVIRSVADQVNAAEREREKSQPGYSPGFRHASLMSRALPSAADRDIAATAINTAASISGLGYAQAAAAAGGTTLEKKIEGITSDGGELDKKLKQIQSAAGVKNPQGIIAEKASFATDQIYAAKGSLKINGVQLDPIGNLPTLIVPSDVGVAIPGIDKMTILQQNAETFLKSPEDAAKQAAKIPLDAAEKEGKKQFKATVGDLQGQADKYLRDNIDLDKLGDKLDLGPFKLTGSSAKVELNDDGTATLHAKAKLPGLTSAIAPPSNPDEKAGDPISIDVDLKGDLNGKITLQGLQLKVPKAYLVGIQLEKLRLTYNDKGLDVGGLITFPLSGGDGILINNFRLGSDGEFLSINVSYLAGAGKGLQVGPGVFLTKIGGGFSAKPYEIYGNAAISAGLPSAGGGCPTVGIDGDVTFHWNPTPLFIHIKGTVVIVCVPLANLDFYADDTGWIKAHGDWGLDLDIVKLSAAVNGEFVTSPNNIWQMDAKGSADFKYIPFPDITMKGALSNRGIAACGSILVKPPILPNFRLAAGAAVGFPGGVPPLNYAALLANFRAFTGCDLGAYTPIRAVRSASAATAAQSFGLAKGSTALSIEGVGGAPKVILRSPAGKTYDFTDATNGKLIDDAFGANVTEEDRTVVILPYATAGKWTAEPSADSVPIARIQSAPVLPQPSVKATLRGKGATRTVRYRIKRIPGQEVSFVESARSGHKLLKTVKVGGHGSFKYALGETRSPKRTVEALVFQDGLPRKTIAVAKYVAKNPAFAKPKVRVKRAGKAAIVSWKRVPTAVRYDVRVRFADGRNLLFSPAGTKPTVRVPAIGKGARITVVAYSRAGRQSTGTAKFRKRK